MRARAAIVVLCAVAALLAAACGSTSHVWVSPMKAVHPARFTAAAVSPFYAETLHWSGVSIANQTGFYAYENGTQVGSPTSSPYVFQRLACGTTYTLGVRAHDSASPINTSAMASVSYTTPVCPTTGLNGVYVNGSKLVNGSGATVVLHGADRSGTEYQCSPNGYGIFDGPSGAASTYTAMASWDINSAFLGLNEDCWLGINGSTVNNFSSDSGTAYINAIKSEVSLMEAAGIYPVIGLMWSDPGTEIPNAAGLNGAGGTDPNGGGQPPLPDSDHSPLFWEEVADTFKSDPNVIFRLFEEPRPTATGANGAGATKTNGNASGLYQWQCWSQGSVQFSTSSVNAYGTAPTPTSSNHNCDEYGTNGTTLYQTVGMQSLVNIIRGTGATNVIQMPGADVANMAACSPTGNPVTCGMLDSTDGVKVTDPLASSGSPHGYGSQLMADFDIYPDAGQVCSNTTCYTDTLAPVMAQMPLDLGEIGIINGSDTAANTLLDWLDSQSPKGNYYAWEWDSYGQLINSYTGGMSSAVSPWGTDYYDRLTGYVPPQPTNGITFRQQAAGDTNPTSSTLTFSKAVSAGDDLFLVASGDGYTAAASTVNSVSDNVNGSWTQVFNTGSQFGGNSDYNSVAVYELVNSKASASGLTTTVNGTWGQSGISSAAVDVGDSNGSATVSATAHDSTIQAQSTSWTAPSLASVPANDLVLGLFGGFCHSGDTFSATSPWTLESSDAGQGCVAIDWQQPSATGTVAATLTGPNEYHYSTGIDLHP